MEGCKKALRNGVGENIAGIFQGERVTSFSFGNGVPAMPQHLTLEEGDRIAPLPDRGVPQKEIALALQRCPSTISREQRGKRPYRRKNKATTSDAAQIHNRPKVIEQ